MWTVRIWHLILGFLDAMILLPLKIKAMKKCVMVIIFVFGLGIRVMAQVDGYFYNSRFKTFKNNNECEVLLPDQHGLDYNYYADNAPLESGCLLLLGMGLLYAKYRIKSTDKN